MLSEEEAIKEFKEIYEKEFGEKIDDQTALELGINLLTFFNNIYRPIKKKWVEEYEKKYSKKSN